MVRKTHLIIFFGFGIIYAYHRETGEIVAYVWGKRHLATVQRLKTKLKQLGIH